MTTIQEAVASTSTVRKPSIDLAVSRDDWREIFPKLTGHLCTYGKPGTGKSYDNNLWAQVWSKANGKKFYEVNVTRQSVAAAYMGHWIDTGHKMEWNHGPIAKAMLEGTILVVNDIHLCSDDLFDLLYFVLDRRPDAVLSLPNGEEIKAGKGFRALCSMNGDPMENLDEPIRDRFQVMFEVNMPSQAQIDALDEDIRQLCVQMYASATGTKTPRVTYRQMQSFCEIRQVTDPLKAAKLAVGSEKKARAFVEAVLAFKGSDAETKIQAAIRGDDLE